MSEVLQVRDLRVGVGRTPRLVHPVDGVSFEVHGGECFGLVGESGAGKSLTLRAIIGLLPAFASVQRGEVLLDGRTYRRGRSGDARIGMIFQEPKASLNPLMRAGDLIKEGLRVRGIRATRASAEAVALLEEVGIEDPERCSRRFPHELSGGQRQRVAIAMALAAEPLVLLCDEPTTALDVTVKARILDLLDRLRIERGLTIVFVTHDLAVIGRISGHVGVMYAGRILESGPTSEVLARPRHPYTARLLASLPRIDRRGRVTAIEGGAPNAEHWPSGCRFRARCTHTRPDCAEAPYTLRGSGQGRHSACIHWAELEHLLVGESE